MNTVNLRSQNLPSPTNGIQCFDSIYLKPGNNFLSDSDLKKLLAHPDAQRFMKLNAIEVVQPQGDSEGLVESNPELQSLVNYTVEQAEPVIEQEHSVEVLEAWLAAEQRVTVQRLINTRITAIKEGRQ
ncbi:MAG: hypothetical protein AAGF24_02195 [Cyanobacteria bacterium P01_H01_bin.121]